MIKLSGKTVLVTGCNGFIGKHLTRRLRSQCRVIGIDHEVSGSEDSMPDLFILGDLTRPFSLMKIKELEQDIECVFHLAAQADVQTSVTDIYRDARWNVLGTVVALEIANMYDCPLVYASSGGTIYGKNGHDLDADLTELAPYALSKKTGEDYCHLYHKMLGLKYLSLRLSNVYGLWGHGVIERWLQLHMEGKPLELYGGQQTRDFVYIDDVVEAFVKAGDALQSGLSPEAGAFDIAWGKATSMEDLAGLFEDRFGAVVERGADQPEGEVMAHHMTVSEAKRTIGWEPTTRLMGGIENTWRAMADQVQVEEDDGQE